MSKAIGGAMKPVIIAGSGPAGLTAAINLARAGKRVRVFERHSDSGKRFYGDIQGLENWSEQGDVLERLGQMGLEINFHCAPFPELAVSNGQRQWRFHCEKPAFYLVKRGAIPGSLDQGLKEQALAWGVEINYGQRLDPEQADIVATGPLANHVFGVAKGQIFKTAMADQALGLVNDDAAFKGYSYLLVSQGYGCICTVLFDRFAEINRCFTATCRQLAQLTSLDIQNPRPVGGLGSFALNPVFRRGNSLYVGEAAGLQDLLWGFGMRSAMVSGFLAARSLIENTDYPRQASRFFKKRLRASLVNRYCWERCGRDNYVWIMDRIDRAPSSRQFMHSFHNFNFFQKLLYPLARRFAKQRYAKLLKD